LKILCPIVTGSGLETYHQRLAIGLSGLGVQTVFYRYSPGWEIFPWLLRRIYSRSSAHDASCDLVHTNAEFGFIFSREEASSLITFHHSTIDSEYLARLSFLKRFNQKHRIKRFVRRSVKCASGLVAVSWATKDMICHALQSELPIQVIHNGIDTEYFAPGLPNENAVRRPIRLFFSGNLSWRKGADLLAPVMNRLGEGYKLYYTSGLRYHARVSADLPNMNCLGRLPEPDLIREINAADIAFQPSRREGFGLSILEAMACGKPVVSTRCSSIPELIEHGKGGLLCEDGDIEQMTEAIRCLAASREMRCQMGDYNRRLVLKKFTLKGMAEKYYEVYRGLVGGERSLLRRDRVPSKS
jgi:glycosyltransferase involved in cell wall biosynthesis